MNAEMTSLCHGDTAVMCFVDKVMMISRTGKYLAIDIPCRNLTNDRAAFTLGEVHMFFVAGENCLSY